MSRRKGDSSRDNKLDLDQDSGSETESTDDVEMESQSVPADDDGELPDYVKEGIAKEEKKKAEKQKKRRKLGGKKGPSYCHVCHLLKKGHTCLSECPWTGRPGCDPCRASHDREVHERLHPDYYSTVNAGVKEAERTRKREEKKKAKELYEEHKLPIEKQEYTRKVLGELDLIQSDKSGIQTMQAMMKGIKKGGLDSNKSKNLDENRELLSPTGGKREKLDPKKTLQAIQAAVAQLPKNDITEQLQKLLASPNANVSASHKAKSRSADKADTGKRRRDEPDARSPNKRQKNSTSVPKDSRQADEQHVQDSQTATEEDAALAAAMRDSLEETDALSTVLKLSAADYDVDQKNRDKKASNSTSNSTSSTTSNSSSSSYQGPVSLTRGNSLAACSVASSGAASSVASCASVTASSMSSRGSTNTQEHSIQPPQDANNKTTDSIVDFTNSRPPAQQPGPVPQTMPLPQAMAVPQTMTTQALRPSHVINQRQRPGFIPRKDSAQVASSPSFPRNANRSSQPSPSRSYIVAPRPIHGGPGSSSSSGAPHNSSGHHSPQYPAVHPPQLSLYAQRHPGVVSQGPQLPMYPLSQPVPVPMFRQNATQGFVHVTQSQYFPPQGPISSFPMSPTNLQQFTAPVPEPSPLLPPFQAEALPVGWEAKWDNVKRRWYYKDHVNKEAQWERPTKPATLKGSASSNNASSSQSPVRMDTSSTTSNNSKASDTTTNTGASVVPSVSMMTELFATLDDRADG